MQMQTKNSLNSSLSVTSQSSKNPKIIIFAYEKIPEKIEKKLSLKRLLLFYPLLVIFRKIKDFWITTFYNSIFDSVMIKPAEYSRAYAIDEKGIYRIDDFDKKYNINGTETEMELLEKSQKRNSVIFISVVDELLTPVFQKKET